MIQEHTPNEKRCNCKLVSYTSSLSTCPRPLPEVEGEEEEEEREGDLTGPLSLPPPPLLLDGIDDDDAVSPPIYVYIVL